MKWVLSVAGALCAVLMVLLVPSTAWAAEDPVSPPGPESSESSPSPSDSPAESDSESSPTPTPDPSPSPTSESVPSPAPEPLCGSGEAAPCEVVLSPSSEAWLLLVGGVVVLTLPALLVTAWGRS